MSAKKLSEDVPANKTGLKAAEAVFHAPTPQTDHLPALTPQEAAFGDLDAESLLVPRLVVLESLSPEVTAEKPLGRPGDLFIQALNENLGKDAREIVLLRRFRSNLRWRPRKDGGGLLCRADDGKVGIPSDGVTDSGGPCVNCPKLQWTTVAPECDQNENFIAVLRSSLESGDYFPFAISCSKARLKDAKALNLQLQLMRQTGKPIYSKSFVLSAARRTSKSVANAIYHSLVFQVGNQNAPLPEAEQAIAAKLAAQMAGAKVEVQQDNAEEAPF